MRKYIFLAFLFTLNTLAFSQNKSNQIGVPEIFRLDIINSNVQKILLKNGLTVYLNSDKNMSDVYGAVVVKGGSKLDPKGGSGVAHYFEHIMFKGSEKLGTVDYKSEKIYLDSIEAAYELLSLSKDDPVFRENIIQNINRLSLKASEYAIPNEFSKVLSSMGGTRINAYTSYENIVYHNHFPAENMNKWIALQVDRFSNPIFRLFQTELETVYEEKNMSMDNMFRNLFEEVYKSFYPNSIYGKQTILGSIEDLKTPSVSKMRMYFKEYYIANNMALILVGNFDDEMIIQWLEGTFGTIREGRDVHIPKSEEHNFKGRVEVTKRMTPISVGILGFRTVPKGHPDETALGIINDLLSNSQSTGLLDELVDDNRIMEAGTFADSHYDIGGNFIYFIPKVLSQSMKKAENLVISKLDSIKEGKFSNDLLLATLTNKRKKILMNLEHAESRSELIMDAFMNDQDLYQSFMTIDRLEALDKSQIQLIAKKYYGEDYLAFISKMGSKKNTKLKKPNFTPLNPINKNSSSILALELSAMESAAISPKYLEFESDFNITDLQNNLHLYSSPNPMNNIYSLNFKIGVGTYLKPELELLANYLNKVGTKNSKFVSFRTQLQIRGTSIHTSVDKNYFRINMTGFDYNMEKDLNDLRSLLSNMERKESILKQFVDEEKMSYKIIKKDPSEQSIILNNYALYGTNSPYLKKLGVKELKKVDLPTIEQLLNEVLSYETYIHYTGNIEPLRLKDLLYRYSPFSNDLKRSISPVDLTVQEISENHIYFLKNKKAIQSQIRYSIPSRSANMEQRNYSETFNRFFGLGMNSVVFREIREFRSLAYGAYAYVQMPFYFKNPVLVHAMMSTQADKTVQAISAMNNILDSLTYIEQDMVPLKQSMLQSINSKLPGFRYNSSLVAYWIRQGYNEDPRKKQFETIQKLEADELTRFYDAFVASRVHNISLVGDSKRIDMKSISNLGEFSKVKLKHIYNQ